MFREFSPFEQSVSFSVSFNYFSIELDFGSSIGVIQASSFPVVDRNSTSWVASDGDQDLRQVEGGPPTVDKWDCDLFLKKFNI